MNVYIIGDIKITTSAEILSVKRITPSIDEIHIEDVVDEYWSNDYFRRNTKSYLVIKGVEVGLRSFSFHQFYLFFREFIYPHLGIVCDYLSQVDCLDLFLHVDIAFILGMVTTAIIGYIKKTIIGTFKSERNE